MGEKISSDESHMEDLLEAESRHCEDDDHLFTDLVRAHDDFGIFIGFEMWQWCIRCGCLKLGEEIFYPGKHQQLTIVSGKA